MKKNMFVITVSALALSACATKPLPPAISYDADNFKPAIIDKEPARPVKIVEVPKVLPLPGQLQPEPGEGTEDKRPPTERVEDANKAATQEPTKYGYVNAIQVYPYTERALHQLYAAPERVSDIALQPGEKLTSVSAGDTVRWVIGDTVSGTGDSERTHVLVKPFAPGLKTNLVITTDRRAYHLQLESTENTAMAAISWTYPSDQLVALRRQNAAQAALPVASNVALENIRFRYAITGDNPPWKPLRAFDDGHKVYIEFPRRIDQGEAPPLFVVGADGGNQLVNYRVRGNYYIVDRLFAAAGGSDFPDRRDAAAHRAGSARGPVGRGAMTDTAAPPPQPAGSSKRDPGKLDLRAAPRRVVRFRRGLVIGVAVLGSGAILGVTMMALQGPALRIQDQTEELYNTERKPTPDGLAALPGDYSQVRPQTPELGPPLPGDLGRPILERQRQLGIAPGAPELSAEEQRLAQQAIQAKEAGVFFRIENRPQQSAPALTS